MYIGNVTQLKEYLEHSVPMQKVEPFARIKTLLDPQI